MATIKQSRNPDLTNYRKAQPTPVSAPTRAQLPQDTAPARSPFMMASMPLWASTSDAFTRQFYGTNVASYRILPVGGTR
jgi:hypothetical protein